MSGSASRWSPASSHATTTGAPSVPADCCQVSTPSSSEFVCLCLLCLVARAQRLDFYRRLCASFANQQLILSLLARHLASLISGECSWRARQARCQGGHQGCDQVQSSAQAISVASPKQLRHGLICSLAHWQQLQLTITGVSIRHPFEQDSE